MRLQSQQAPQGETPLPRAEESAKNRDPFSCSSGRQAAPREARRPRRAAPNPQGPRFPPVPSPGQG
eukprot:5116324-Alexandrium_andersonii.AAC.1